ncbi:hypothetical protein EYZ11_010574 [Aspergillus tanneri]|uniref:Uncharacterized protein n=1 Tax=Aspergillus tanneri TaxID=1220188 RepID=A0A4S3JAE1_9EURO|nr:uncharacterized protein ATNIH1004_004587 [Aspergillus tanneri]KAA8648702.1 hypothetical protein ATNIH1004_004587 [Aspergillus tanneri]THC89971.1 hypothetical protein EYZ11_010574 [Aspergillus tanneri]
MSRLDLSSSESSYGGDPGYSANSLGAPQPPPTKTVVDGYPGTFDSQNAETSRYNPLNTMHPQSSALNTNDPVAMYLLTETAIGDSKDYEILSLEEVEGLKKEYKFLSGRLDAAKRKLALETKLRDAAMSLSKLYNPKSPRVSDEYNAGGSPGSNHSQKISPGNTGATGPMDKTDGELAVIMRKCEDLSQEIWNLERRVQLVQKRLLEHTAGILQVTHKGLKKNMNNNIPHTPESLSSHNTRDSVDEFDDRSLYKPSAHVHEPGGQGTRRVGATNGSEQMAIGLDALHNVERRLEELSERMRTMILESDPNSDLNYIPQLSNSGGPVSPTAMAEAHLAYIEDGLGVLEAQPAGASRSQDVDYETEQKLREINAQLHHIVSQSGLSRAQPLPPPPQSSSANLSEQLSYLGLGVDNLQQRVEGFLEQKSILTTQIQQQRELNSKSDAQRDAHIADLIEQLAHVKKDLELSEREAVQSRDQLHLAMEQLENGHRDLPGQQLRNVPEDHSSALESEKEARTLAEAEIAHLRNVMQELQHEKDAQADAHEARLRAEAEVARLHNVMQELQHEKEAQADSHEARLRAEAEIARLQKTMHDLQQEKEAQADAHEARLRAEDEVTRLEAHIKQLHSGSNAHTEELNAVRSEADSEMVRLQSVIDQLRREADAKAEEAEEARERAEQRISQLEDTMQQVRSEADARVEEAVDKRAQAEKEIERLEASMNQLRVDIESQLQEATQGRTHAEENAKRLQGELTELEGEIVRVQTELTMAKAELDGAYGSRAQRAADIASNPAIQKEFDELHTRNIELAEELASLKAGRPGSGDLQHRVEMLEKELRETVDDYEVMTRASIEFEKERERFEGHIDSLRDRCEQLETQLNEERINWMGHNASMGRDGTYETTSTMVLKNEFKKMMRDTRVENMKILKGEQEERRRLETLVRNLKKEQANANGKLVSQSVTAL